MPDNKIDKKPGADWSAVMPKQIVPAANLLTPPMGAIAAASVLSLGIASQMWGLWAGALAGVLDANTKLKPLGTVSETDAKQASDVAELKTIIRKKSGETAPKAVAVTAADVPVTGSTAPVKLVATEKSVVPDDLKRISGVGPKLEKVLNGLGVYTYAQIAAWSAQEVARIDDHLKFGGRIVRDEWTAQAKALQTPSGEH